MSARQSAEVKRALRLVFKGATPYAAAKAVGVRPSSVYRAMKRAGIVVKRLIDDAT
jgi:hypothetical protein